MKLILLRHGKTEEEQRGIILGNLPGTLSAKGREEAVKIAGLIKAADLRPETILASDLARAADYAAIIGRELDLDVELEPLMRERGAGVVEGKNPDEIDWEEYEKVPKPLRKHPGGESFEDVRSRAKEFLKKIRPLPFHTVILVSHSVFLAMITVEICGWTLEKALAYNFRDPLIVDMDKKGAEEIPPR